MARVLENDGAIQACIERLGYTHIKKEQKEAVFNFIVKRRDVFLCLPTGFGKSLCFYSLPIMEDILAERSTPWSLIVIVSPLIALMKDQVRSLHQKGLSATVILGDESQESAVVRGDYQYIFTTPELLLRNKSWSNVFQSVSFVSRLVGIVIDEAHCVKKWGTDFRKEFSMLGELRGFFPPKVRMMAVTATASPTTRKEVIRMLGMQKPFMIVRCPDKANIFYSVEEKNGGIEEGFASLVEELREKRMKFEKTIIFCRSYNDCSSIYIYFKDILREDLTDPPCYPNVSKFRLVDMFTACNSAGVKTQILSSFAVANGRLRIVIATVAFGMGIDCPNVRRVIHWSPPSDCEAYIQETGRAGRDGETAYAILYYAKRDISYSFMDKAIIQYCRNTQVCRRVALFKEFDYSGHIDVTGCKCCDLCAMICECSNCLDIR